MKHRWTAHATTMTVAQFINIVVLITLIEMMIAIGLGVSLADLAAVVRNQRSVAKAALANYLCVPVVTVGLLLLFHPADPIVDATKIIVTLLATQLVSLYLGLGVRHWLPKLANQLLRIANLVSAVLNLAMISIVLVLNGRDSTARLRGHARPAPNELGRQLVAGRFGK